MVDLLTLMALEQQLVLVGSAVGGYLLYKKLKIVLDLPAQFGKILTDFGTSMKMSGLGKRSGEVRAESAMIGNILEEGFGDDVVMSQLMQLPELRGAFKKYPFLAPIAQGLVKKYAPQIIGAVTGVQATNQPANRSGLASESKADEIKRLQALVSP